MCGVSRPRPMSAYNVCGLCLCVWVGVGVTDRQRHGEQERCKTRVVKSRAETGSKF